MIISLWLLLFAIASLMVLFSKTYRYPLLTFAGWTFLFLLCIMLLPGNEGIDYKTGENMTNAHGERIEYTYGNNFTSYHWDYSSGAAPSCQNPNDPSCVWLFHTNETGTDSHVLVNVYSNYTSLWFGSWLSILTALMFILEIINFRSDKREV